MQQPMVSSVNSSLQPAQIAMQEKLAICLALVAGFVDATGLIKWKTYVSFMSGNTTQLGSAISSDQFGTMIISLTVIGCFVCGIYLGTCLSLSKLNKTKALTFYLVSGILIVYTVAANVFAIPAIPSVAIIGLAMGLMNAIVTAVGNQNVNTDFVTGTLNSLARNTAMLTMSNDELENTKYRSNAIHLLLVWLGFLSGAFMAHYALIIFGAWILLLPALVLLICSRFYKSNRN